MNLSRGEFWILVESRNTYQNTLTESFHAEAQTLQAVKEKLLPVLMIQFAERIK